MLVLFRLQGAIQWICVLSTKNVTQSVRNFSSTLHSLTSPTNAATLSLRQYLTHIHNTNTNGTASHTTTNASAVDQNTLDGVLLKLLLHNGATDTLPPLVHFLLQLLHGNTTEAVEVVQRLLNTLRIATALDTQCSGDVQIVLQHVVWLQYMLKLMEARVHYTADTNARDTHIHLLQQLCQFSKQYTALLPVIACAVRSAVLYCALLPQDTK